MRRWRVQAFQVIDGLQMAYEPRLYRTSWGARRQARRLGLSFRPGAVRIEKVIDR